MIRGLAMLGNEREYRIATVALGQFEEALDRLNEGGAVHHPLFRLPLREHGG